MKPDWTINFLCLAAMCGLASCVGRDPPSIQSQDPDQLVPAIKIAVDKGDKRVIPILVKDLDSDDPAVRMYAIDGLRRLTGQDLGYVYYAASDDRKISVQRWHDWYPLYAPSN